jgi:release factor glutamine methyltransferase
MRYAVIASNPPYIAAGDPHLDAGDLRYEPRLALVGGRDGLVCLRRIIDGAPAHLQPDGWLLLEHGCEQGAAVRALFGPAWADAGTWTDPAGLPRVTGARLVGAA